MWIVVALVVATIVAGGLRHRFYSQWFRLPSNRSDLLPSRDATTRGEVTLDAGGVQIPPGTLAHYSVLLRLTLRARLSGHLFDPYVEMRAGKIVMRQYFERGATGERYLNLSPMFQDDELCASMSRIALRARGLRWKLRGTLETFPVPRFEGARILVLAPHPDDAELAGFGVYMGRNAWVATITAGERSGASPAAQLRRVEESLAVPRLASVPPEQTISLAFPDGTLASMHRDPSTAFRLACEESQPRAQLRALNVVPRFRVAAPDCRWEDLVGELRALLAHARPDIVVAPHPLLDSHPDHVFTAVALETAMRQSNIYPELFLYVVHIAGAPMHPPGGFASVVGLPPLRHAEWVAEQIHSHPLDAVARLIKRQSLLAMSAVRESAGLASETPDRASAVRRLRNRLAGVGAYPASLLRRADRPNEIYYRVRGSEFAALVGRLRATDL